MSDYFAEFNCGSGRLILGQSSSASGNRPLWLRYNDHTGEEKAAIHLRDHDQDVLIALLTKWKEQEQ